MTTTLLPPAACEANAVANVRTIRRKRQQDAWRAFGTIGFEAYRAWVLAQAVTS